MKKIIINSLNILLIIACIITTTYGWFINGSFGDGVVIKSAKIDSIVTLEKGIVFNRDGVVDIDDSGNKVFELIEKTNKGTEQVIIMDFDNIAPSEVFTFKVTVLNKGDVAGYVYADLYDEIDFTDGISKEEEFLKFMSVSSVIKDSNGNNTIHKKYLNNSTNQSVLFGGTDEHIVELGGSIEIEFMITFEIFDDLLEQGICSEEERDN